MAKNKTADKPTAKKTAKKNEVVDAQVVKLKALKEATPEEKIAEISTDVVKVEKQFKAINIVTEDDYNNASSFLTGTVQARIKRVKEIQEFFTEPYVEQRRVALAKKNEIEALFGKQLIPLSNIETALKRSMSNFQLKKEEEAKKEEAKLLKQQQKQEEKAEAKGVAFVPTPIAVERPMQTVRTVSGQSTAIKVWKFEVTNVDEVPRQYCEVNETMIRNAVKSGVREIKGVRIFEDFDIRGRTI